MTAVDLVRRVVALLTDAVEDLRLEPADGGADRAPVVVEGWLPPPRHDDERRPPLVLVRAARGSDEEDGSRTTLIVAVECHTDDVAGWQDATTVMQRCRSALLAIGTLGPHVRELPISWELADEQPLPQWIGVITSTWLSPRVEYLGATE